MPKKIILIVTLLLLMACHNSEATNPEPTRPTILAPQNLPASYYGRIPCADCEAIELSLSLYADNTYCLKQKYSDGKVDKKPEFVELGRWQLEDSKNILVLEDQAGHAQQFKMETPETLLMLDISGQEAKSGHNYQLRKTSRYVRCNTQVVF